MMVLHHQPYRLVVMMRVIQRVWLVCVNSPIHLAWYTRNYEDKEIYTVVSLEYFRINIIVDMNKCLRLFILGKDHTWYICGISSKC